MTKLIDETEVEPKFEDLVGEGKKYQDNDALARSKHHADKHIFNLEKELAELREDLKAREQVEALINKFESKLGTSTREEPPLVEQPVTQIQGLSEKDILSLVDKHVSQQEQKRSRDKNLEDAKAKLTQAYGDRYGDVVKKKAQELGMSIERLTEIAAESPTALMKLVSQGEVTKGSSFTPPRSTQAPARTGFEDSNVRNYAYWQKLRRENPSQYHSPKMSMQRMKDASEQGDAFYER